MSTIVGGTNSLSLVDFTDVYAHGFCHSCLVNLRQRLSARNLTDAAIERDREEVNAWIRQPGHFDKVIDFSKIMEDPTDPQRLNPKYDSGGHLHPGPSGYKHMADSIPLKWFSR